MQHRVVVTNRIHEDVLARLQAVARVDMNPALEPWAPDELGRRLRSATAMMGFMTDRVDDTLLAQAPQLRIVACALKGYDAYDVAACARRGVCLSIVPDLLTEPTAELAIGLAIGLARHLRAGDAVVRAPGYAGWRAHLYGTGLRGATVAVVGLGLVGRAIVERLAGFGCGQVLGVDPASSHAAARPASLDEALATAHFVFLAVPLTPGSRHLVDARRLARARAGLLLVNVGRGSVVDEEAVAAALNTGHLGGYASDVFACEDWGLDERPTQVPPALRDAPRTLFTPHLGSAVRDVRLAIEHRAADNILAVLQGQEPPDRIDPPRLAVAWPAHAEIVGGP